MFERDRRDRDPEFAAGFSGASGGRPRSIARRRAASPGAGGRGSDRLLVILARPRYTILRISDAPIPVIEDQIRLAADRRP